MKAQEQSKPENNPSMDEILQSIRGVINEDATEDNKSSNNKEEDILELTEVVESTSASITPRTQDDITPPKSQSTPVATNAAQVEQTTPADMKKKTAINIENTESKTTSEVVPKAEAENKVDEVKPEQSLLQAEALPRENDNKTVTAEVAKETIAQTTAQETTITTQNITAVPSTEPKIEAQLEAKIDNPSESTQQLVQDNTPTDITANNPEIKQSSTNNNKIKDAEARPKSHLVSDKVANEATTAIKDLMSKAFKPHTDGLKFRSGTTVEELVIEAIKPYLSNWLDENLPSIVKTLVEKEIKKLMPNDD